MRSNVAGDMRCKHEDAVYAKSDQDACESSFDQRLYYFFDMHLGLEEDSND